MCGMSSIDPAYAPPPGLDPFRSGLLTVVHETHMDMVALIQGLPIEALKWMPVPKAPHVSGIALHILEVEDYLAAVAAGADLEWDRPLGASNDYVYPAGEVVRRIGETDARLKRAIEQVTPERLARLQPGQERTIGEMLVEDLAHSSMHLGHIQLTRQLCELTLLSLQFPPYEPWA